MKLRHLLPFWRPAQPLAELLKPSPPPEPAPSSVPPPPASRFVEAAGVTIDPDGDNWTRLTGDSQRNLSAPTQARMREIAAWLWQTNLLANRLIELPLAFLLAEGARLEVKNEQAAQILKRFWNDPITNMPLKLSRRIRELALFGEACYPAFVNEIDGHLRLGYLDPSLIETVVVDPDNAEQPIGIVTVKDKRGHARRFRIIVPGADEDVFTRRTQEIRQTFTDGECFFFCVNSLMSGARGRSDLLAPADWTDAYDDFLFGELDRAAYQRAFLWDVTLTGATPEEVKERAKKDAPPRPNSVRYHNESEIWNTVTPDLKTQDTTNSARLIRNHVLGGGSLPEHWFGGGGDVNRSVGAEMGDPAFKIFSLRQQDIKFMLASIGRHALVCRQRIVGDLGDLDDPDFEVGAVFPEMVAKDISKYSTALQQVVASAGLSVERGLLSQATAIQIIAAVAGRLGIDIDAPAEIKAVQQARADQAEQDTFTTPPAEGDDGTTH